jgi:hypothetical protein
VVAFTVDKDSVDTTRAGFDSVVKRVGADAKPINLGYGDQASLLANGPGKAQILMQDDNLTIMTAYICTPATAKSAQDSLTYARNVMQQAYDAIQPK